MRKSWGLHARRTTEAEQAPSRLFEIRILSLAWRGARAVEILLADAGRVTHAINCVGMPAGRDEDVEELGWSRMDWIMPERMAMPSVPVKETISPLGLKDMVVIMEERDGTTAENGQGAAIMFFHAALFPS